MKVLSRVWAWQNPIPFSPFQSFILHIVQLLLKYHMDMSLYNDARKLAATLWSERWLINLNLLNEKALLSMIVKTCGVIVRPCLIGHPNDPMRYFASQTFSKGSPVRYHHGTFLFKDMARFLTTRCMVTVWWQCPGKSFVIPQFKFRRSRAAHTESCVQSSFQSNAISSGL